MHLGLIGYGNIATSLVDLLAADSALCPSDLTVLVRPGKAVSLRPGIAATVVDCAADLIARRPDLVVECAGHSGVADHVPAVLEAGIDVVLVSIGALANADLDRRLRAAARSGGARLILTAGAVGGIDLLAALGAAGDLSVRYRGTKPPRAWAGTPAESACDLDGMTKPAVFFSGTARQAARDYPRNANVAATLALAGAGFDETRVELAADPGAGGNMHAYDVTSPHAEFRVEIRANPSAGNAKTSVSTVYSVLREIRNRVGPVAI